MAAILAAAGTAYAMKRKLRAQALCVRQAVLLQNDLRKTLDELMGLNPKAQRLRQARLRADQAVTAARASGYPPAIAMAEAARLAVILQQSALRARQLGLLARAAKERVKHHQILQRETIGLAAGAVGSKMFFAKPLAVSPTPLLSLSPDYRTIEGFKKFQSHQFEFQTNLTPAFFKFRIRQTTLCTVSLSGKEKSWQTEILAASALSKPLGFY